MLQENGTQASESALRGEAVRKLLLRANFYSPTPGLEVTRFLLAMALSKDLTILFGDISVAFMNTLMPEGDPVYVEPPEGLYEHNDTVRCLKRALNGLRDASRLFHGHFADVLTFTTWFHTIRSSTNAFRGPCAQRIHCSARR